MRREGVGETWSRGPLEAARSRVLALAQRRGRAALAPLTDLFQVFTDLFQVFTDLGSPMKR